MNKNNKKIMFINIILSIILIKLESNPRWLDETQSLLILQSSTKTHTYFFVETFEF